MRGQRYLFLNIISKLWKPGKHLHLSSSINFAYSVCSSSGCNTVLEAGLQRSVCASLSSAWQAGTGRDAAHRGQLHNQHTGTSLNKMQPGRLFMLWWILYLMAYGGHILHVFDHMEPSKNKGIQTEHAARVCRQTELQRMCSCVLGGSTNSWLCETSSPGTQRKQHMQGVCVLWLAEPEGHPEQLGRGTSVWPGYQSLQQVSGVTEKKHWEKIPSQMWQADSQPNHNTKYLMQLLHFHLHKISLWSKLTATRKY